LGYRPGKLPLAINFSRSPQNQCILCTACDGFPCPVKAKNDLELTILQEAQAFGLEILTGVIVDKVIEENGRISAVECLNKKARERFIVTADRVVVSGGAIQSPALLLRSNLEGFDHSRHVGKFLMRHCNAVVGSFFPFKTNPEGIYQKQMTISTFYEDLREELSTSVGVIQDFTAPPRDVVAHIAPPGASLFTRLTYDYGYGLLCIAEDKPNSRNTVSLSDREDNFGMPRIKVKHRYCAQDRRRRRYLTKRAKKILARAGGRFHFTVPITTFAHAMGTVRFGHDPEDAPLDPYCRFFGISNLYVVDASFMPTSGGVNPSLTIAANALRVADHILEEALVPGEKKIVEEMVLVS
jgi:choline dehydrogenase-like flavoprotein